MNVKCSLGFARNSRIRKLASGYFCLKRKTRFLRNTNTMTTYLKHVEIIKFQATNTNDTSLESSLKV